MRFLVRLLILIFAFAVVLTIAKFVFFKIFAFALWAAIIGVILFAVYSVLKTA